MVQLPERLRGLVEHFSPSFFVVVPGGTDHEEAWLVPGVRGAAFSSGQAADESAPVLVAPAGLVAPVVKSTVPDARTPKRVPIRAPISVCLVDEFSCWHRPPGAATKPSTILTRATK